MHAATRKISTGLYIFATRFLAVPVISINVTVPARALSLMVYTTLFGAPPLRDINRLREATET